MSNAFVIPFRCRGNDPLRQANREFVEAYVHDLDLGPVYVVSDGRQGMEPFNRHAAYNTGSELAFSRGATTVTYYEADMLVPKDQLVSAIKVAEQQVRLAIPYTARRELERRDSDAIRVGRRHFTECSSGRLMRKPRRSGAVNVLSKATLDTVGRWDSSMSGSWWDDRSMLRAFEVCTGREAEWIPGTSWTLYHLPGYEGAHLTPEDRAATRANKARFRLYQQATTPEQIHQLTMETR